MNNEVLSVNGGKLQEGLNAVLMKQQNEIISVIEHYFLEERSSMKKEIMNEIKNDMKKELLEEMTDELIKYKKKEEIYKREVNVRIENVEKQSNVAYKRTNTLAFTGKAKELSNAVKSKAFQYSGDKGTAEYILFYNKIIGMVYKKLKDYYEVNSYAQIDADNLENCLDRVEEWRFDRKNKKKILLGYQKEQSKGLLTEKKERALDLYLSEIGGIL